MNKFFEEQFSLLKAYVGVLEKPKANEKESGSKFCSNCGQKAEGSRMFCSGCGHQL